MNQLYIDGAFGISGNSAIGAFLSMGMKPSYLENILNLLIPKTSYKLIIRKKTRNDRTLCYFNTESLACGKEFDKIGALDVLQLVSQSKLPSDIKLSMWATLKNLMLSKADAHSIPLTQVDFRYEGMLDTLIDIAGFCAGLHLFKVKKVFVNKINVGSGVITLGRREMTLPAPMTNRLLEGFSIYQNSLSGELVTPTGAALLRTHAHYCDFPYFRDIAEHGYGLPKAMHNETQSLHMFLIKADDCTSDKSFICVTPSPQSAFLSVK